MNITAKITGIKYKPLLCKELKNFDLDEIGRALSTETSFILKISEKDSIAVSWWVSAKRTRSYPYARVYNSLSFSGRKITIIPILKDEGKDGDRDFLQWDTVSLMSLLGIYVIIAYYKDAAPSSRYENKITGQRFDVEYIKKELRKLLSYQSDALHWNLEQIDKVGDIGKKSLECYNRISKDLNKEMHSRSSAEKRIKELLKGKEVFMELSRKLAEKAQKRETITVQPKERIDGSKSTITIKNYLGGYYYFTSDEVTIVGDEIHLIEAKNTVGNKLPSKDDIKDGLIKMILFSNLKEVKIGEKNYKPVPTLKLTTGKGFDIKKLEKPQKEILDTLNKEAKLNGFRVSIN